MQVFLNAALLAGMALSTTTSAQTTEQTIVPAKPGDAEFEKHRPVYHFLARKNWMNDPCAPYYDEEDSLYHMFYQSNPNATEWGNMTWGHAVSEDQVTWSDYPDALLPFEDKWDYLGVFSGFSHANAIEGKHTVFYTGVTALPISWKKEYLFGEHVVYATTEDQGKTWQKGDKPLVELPPEGLNVTGWRDPNVFQSTSLDEHYGIVNAKEGTSNYMIVAGGVHGVGPRIFLYHSDNYVDWKFKDYLLAQEKNTTFSPYSGSWGFNFETTIYHEMTDEEGVKHNAMLFAAEGDPNRYPMWAVGDIGHKASFPITATSAKGLFQPRMVGVTDRSVWYANSIYQDKDEKDVLIGWITEENGFDGVNPQGWSGMLSVPREVSIAIVRNIHDPEARLNAAGDWILSDESDVTCPDGTTKTAKTIKTMGFKPLSNLENLRGDKHEKLSSVHVGADDVVPLNTAGKAFELAAEVSEFDHGSRVGVQVRRSTAGDEVTTIVYDDEEKKVIIDRSNASSADCAPFTTYDVEPVTEDVWSYFYLYDQFNSAEDAVLCDTTRETLRLRVFVDVSSVEVFVNDRFALSARIYPCESQTASDGIALISSGNAVFDNVEVWSNPKHAWADEREVPSF